MMKEGFFSETKQIIQALGEKNAVKKILVEYALPSALRNDLHGLGQDFIRLLKANRSDICETLWNAGITTTVKACMHMNLEALIELVEGFDLQGDFLSRSDSDNLLVRAMSWGKFEMAEYLLSKNANPEAKGFKGYTTLHALATGWVANEKLAYRVGVRILSKYPELIYEKNDHRRLPLIIAIRRGNKNTLNFILSNMSVLKPQIDFPDKNGDNPLMRAIENACRESCPQSDIIKILLEHGADCHFRNPVNLWNAWHYACCTWY